MSYDGTYKPYRFIGLWNKAVVYKKKTKKNKCADLALTHNVQPILLATPWRHKSYGLSNNNQPFTTYIENEQTRQFIDNGCDCKLDKGI